MSRLHSVADAKRLPALDQSVATAILTKAIRRPASAPRILLLCGSLHPLSRSHVAVQEAARLLQHFGAEPRIFDASDLPLPDRYSNQNRAVLELRALSRWSHGQVWCNAENRGSISSLIKAQIDHLKPRDGEGPCSGRTLAIMQVFNGVQPLQAVNTLRALGRKLGMLVVPSEVCLNLFAEDIDEDQRMNRSPGYQQIADVMERLVRLTVAAEPLKMGTQKTVNKKRKMVTRQHLDLPQRPAP